MERPVSEQLRSLKDRIQKFREMLNQPDPYREAQDDDVIMPLAPTQSPYFPPFVPKKIAERHPSKKYGFHQFDDQFSDDSSDNYFKTKKNTKHTSHSSRNRFDSVRQNHANYTAKHITKDKPTLQYSNNKMSIGSEVHKNSVQIQNSFEIPKKPLLFVKPEPRDLKYIMKHKYSSSDDSSDYDNYSPNKNRKHYNSSSSDDSDSFNSEDVPKRNQKYQRYNKKAKYNSSSEDSDSNDSDSYDYQVILKPKRTTEDKERKSLKYQRKLDSGSSDEMETPYSDNDNDSESSDDDDYKLKELLRKAEQIQTSFSRISAPKPVSSSAQMEQHSSTSIQNTSEVMDDEISVSYADAEVSATSDTLSKPSPRRTVKSPIRFDGGVNDLLSRVMLAGDSISEDSDPPPAPKPKSAPKAEVKEESDTESDSETPTRSFDFEAFKARLQVSDDTSSDAAEPNSSDHMESQQMQSSGNEESSGSIDLQREQDKDAQFLQQVQKLLRSDPAETDSDDGDDDIDLNFGDLGSDSDSSDTL